jgi:hypothetical protein
VRTQGGFWLTWVRFEEVCEPPSHRSPTHAKRRTFVPCVRVANARTVIVFYTLAHTHGARRLVHDKRKL